jgi:Transmembrane protein 231
MRWQPGTAGSDFVARIKLRVPSAEAILCRPGFAELLKHAWVQYLAIMFVVLWIVTCMRQFAYGQQILPTRVRSPATKGANIQRF